MCGIAGVWSDYSIDKKIKIIDTILNHQSHRGPDNKKRVNYGNLCLGHNRLAIIDLSEKANQPLVSNCGNYIIVFNGEIYNYLELKSKIDYHFSTFSDTEVLLAYYIKYGNKCLSLVNGMFSFAIYDNVKKELFCARDRIGKKPFVYSEHNSGFYFASELGALLKTNIFSSEEDEIGLAYSVLRNFRHIPEPYTKYKDIRRLEPAHAMIVKEGKVYKKWCYWSPSLSYGKVCEDEIYDTIDQAVKIRERSDVEIATLLSGGVDSSIISALMVSHGLKPTAYTLNADKEELERAKRISKFLDLDINIFDYDKNLQKNMFQKMINIYGETVDLLPLTHASRLFQQIASNKIKVVMTGIGADEIFYGYNGANLQLIFSDIVNFLELLPNKCLKMFKKIFTFNPTLKLLFDLASIENDKRKGFLYRMESKNNRYDFDFGFLMDFWSEKVSSDKYIDISNWIGLICENAHSITISCDLPAMMYGIETRAPFLDYKVIELAFKINAHEKVSKIYKKKNNKLILKKTFERLLPKDILYSPKKGFGYGIK